MAHLDLASKCRVYSSHVTNGGTGRSEYHWHLTDVQRIKHPRKPRGRPQPVWFRPF